MNFVPMSSINAEGMHSVLMRPKVEKVSNAEVPLGTQAGLNETEGRSIGLRNFVLMVLIS